MKQVLLNHKVKIVTSISLVLFKKNREKKKEEAENTKINIRFVVIHVQQFI